MKYKEPKVSVIEDEKERMELSPAYKEYLSVQRGYEDLRHRFDVDNLTYDEYAKMCSMLKDKGMLNIEEHGWAQLHSDNWYHPPSGSYIELPQREYDRLMAMADTHPDPFRFGRILGFATKRQDEGNPITFDEMLDLANPSKTPNWIDESNMTSIAKFDISNSNQRYNWLDVIIERLTEAEKSPYVKPEDKVNFKHASMKMLDILQCIKNAKSHS